jgi:pimeloyl-ACP methyl ester carboxylesterase
MARFVLVHGAFHGAWCWEPLIPGLEAAGHTVETFDLPGSGDDPTPLAEVTVDGYAERICRALAERDEPAVLVGHSMGGIAVTQAAARCPDRIARLIYVAGFLPGDGQSLVDLSQLPEGAGDMVQDNVVVEGEPPIGTMPPDAARAAFYGMCTDEQAAWALERLCPQALVAFVTPVALGGHAPDSLSRAYVVATQDRAMPTALQRRLVAENPDLDAIELDSDHSPMLSRTAELAEALNRLAA